MVDADALWALSRDMGVLENAACPTVLTPHEGEFTYLGGRLSGDRVSDARRFAERWGCTLVLKGEGSVIAFPDGECYVNRTGNPGMAKGGSGDVLTGLMAAMLCQLPLRDAVRAVYLHGPGRHGGIGARRVRHDTLGHHSISSGGAENGDGGLKCHAAKDNGRTYDSAHAVPAHGLRRRRGEVGL